jgi:hypothetical protein
MKRKLSKRLKRFGRDREGVASVVGTIMALMVFLAFLSLFINQWVPVMINDNEAQHMTQVINQFGQLKQAIDSLVVNWPKSEAFNMYTAVTMNSPGVPLFAAETPGELSLRIIKKTGNYGYNTGEFTVQTWGGTGTYPGVSQSSVGSIRFYSGNRQYVPQSIIYENGAIIISQQEGSSVKGSPGFTVQKLNSSISLKFELVKLMGVDTVVGSHLAGASPVEGINARMLFVTSEPTNGGVINYGNNYRNVSINLTTDHYKGWFNYFNNSLTQKLGPATAFVGHPSNLDSPGADLDLDTFADDHRVSGPTWSLTFYKSYNDVEKNDRIVLELNRINIIGITVATIWVSIGETNMI